MGRVRKYVKKQYNRAKTFLKKRYGTSGGLGRVVKDVAYLKSLVNVEHKWADRLDIPVNCWSASPYLAKLSDIDQGTTAASRTGNSIKVSSLHMRGLYQVRNGSTTGRCTVRCIVFMDKEPVSGTALTWDKLLDNTDVKSFKKFESWAGKRFHLMMDRTYNLDGNANKDRYDFNYYFKVNKHLRWNAATGSDATMTENPIYALFITNDGSGAASVDRPAIELSTRMRFIDN